MQETVRDVGLVPGSGRSPGGGTDNPLQYSCLEIPMDRVDWWALVHRVAMNQIRLKQLSNGSIKGEKKCISLVELGSALETAITLLTLVGQNILNIIKKFHARYASLWIQFIKMLL